MKKTIEGKTLDGEKRVYEFELMDARTGLELEYNSLGKFLGNDDVIKMFTSGELELTFISMTKMLNDLFNFGELSDLAKKMLAKGHVVVGADTFKHEFGEDGFAEYMRGDLMEFCTALFHAIWANYPKVLGPLFGAGEDTKSDSPPQLTAPKKKRQSQKTV